MYVENINWQVINGVIWFIVFFFLGIWAIFYSMKINNLGLFIVGMMTIFIIGYTLNYLFATR